MNKKYRANCYQKIVDVSDMTIIYTNEETVHVLNSIAGKIFHDIIEGKNYLCILTDIVNLYPDTDKEVIHRDMDELINLLIEKNIIFWDNEYDEN